MLDYVSRVLYRHNNKDYTIGKIINDNRIDFLDYIYDNTLYDINMIDDFVHTIAIMSVNSSNLEIFKWVYQKFSDYRFSNEILHHVFSANKYEEFVEYILDNIYYDYINLDCIQYSKNQIQYCINNMDKLKLKYSSKMIERLVISDYEDIKDILNFVLQASIDGILDYKIWLGEKIVDNATYDNLVWLYEKYKLNLLPFSYTINAIHKSRCCLKKIKFWVSKQDEFAIKCDINLQDMSFEVFKYLSEEQNIINIVLNTDTIYTFIINDQIDILEYLINQNNTDELSKLLQDNYIDQCDNVYTLKWLYSKHVQGLIPFNYSHKAFDYAVINGHIKICKFFVDNCIDNNGDLELKQRVDSDDFNFYLVNVKTIIYLLSIRDLIKINIERVIKDTNSPNVLDYLYKNYTDEFHFTSRVIDNCRSLHILKWWFENSIENGGTIDLLYTKKALDNILKSNYDETGILRYWYDNRFKFTPKFTVKYLISYVNFDYKNRKFYLDLIR